MRFSIYEEFPGGHHLTYLRYFTECLCGRVQDLVVISPLGEDLKRQIAPPAMDGLRCGRPLEVTQQVHFGLPGVFPNQVARSLKYLRRARRSIEAVSGRETGTIFFPTIYDHQAAALRLGDGWIGRPWSALYLNARQLYPQWRDRGKAATLFPPLRAFCGRHLKALAILDEALIDQFRSHGVRCPIVTFPDVTDPTPADPTLPLPKEIKRRAGGRTVVSLLGHLQKSKGMATFVRMTKLLPADEFFFVLAGEISWNTFSEPEVAFLRETLAPPAENLLVQEGHMQDGAAFNSLVEASDILFLAYEDFPNSSNMLTKAALFQRPVVTSTGYCMGRRTEQFRLGLTVPEANPEASAAAVRQLRTGAFSLSPAWEEYRRRHDPAALREAFATLLDAAAD